MTWLTRALTGSRFDLCPPGTVNGGPPVGALRPDGVTARVWYGLSYLGPQRYRDSVFPFTTWSAEQTWDSGQRSIAGDYTGTISNVRRGNPNGPHPLRLHAVTNTGDWYKDASYGDHVARACTFAEVNWPTAVGNKIVYKPFYRYSDDGGDTWSAPEAIAYTGSNAAPMDIVELNNGDILVSWYGNGVDNSPPYFSTGDYPDTKVSRKDHVTGLWSVVGTIGLKSTYGAPVVEAMFDVIRDGSTYGKIVCVFTVEDGLTSCYWTTSTNGGVTWTTPTLMSQQGSNRRGLIVAPDGDLIWSYYSRLNTAAVFRVSRDEGATWGPEQDATGAPGSGWGHVWCTAIPVAPSGVSPNVLLAFGTGTDNMVSSQVTALTRGSDVLANTVVGRSVDQQFVIKALAGKSLAQSWNDQARVAQSCAMAYAVEAVHAGLSLPQPSVVKNVVGRSIGIGYSVSFTIGRSLEFNYAIPATTTSFATDRRLGPPQVTYNTLRRVAVGASFPRGRSLYMTYQLSPPVSAPLSLPYVINAVTSRSLQQAWLDLILVGRSIDIGYKIAIGKSLDQQYLINAVIYRRLVMPWADTGIVGHGCGMQYDIGITPHEFAKPIILPRRARTRA